MAAVLTCFSTFIDHYSTFAEILCCVFRWAWLQCWPASPPLLTTTPPLQKSFAVFRWAWLQCWPASPPSLTITPPLRRTRPPPWSRPPYSSALSSEASPSQVIEIQHVQSFLPEAVWCGTQCLGPVDRSKNLPPEYRSGNIIAAFFLFFRIRFMSPDLGQDPTFYLIN